MPQRPRDTEKAWRPRKGTEGTKRDRALFDLCHCLTLRFFFAALRLRVRCLARKRPVDAKSPRRKGSQSQTKTLPDLSLGLSFVHFVLFCGALRCVSVPLWPNRS